MRVTFTAYCVSFFLTDTKIVSSGVGVDCSHVVQFTAHFAYLDLFQHFKFPQGMNFVGSPIP